MLRLHFFHVILINHLPIKSSIDGAACTELSSLLSPEKIQAVLRLYARQLFEKKLVFENQLSDKDPTVITLTFIDMLYSSGYLSWYLLSVICCIYLILLQCDILLRYILKQAGDFMILTRNIPKTTSAKRCAFHNNGIEQRGICLSELLLTILNTSFRQGFFFLSKVNYNLDFYHIRLDCCWLNVRIFNNTMMHAVLVDAMTLHRLRKHSYYCISMWV